MNRIAAALATLACVTGVQAQSLRDPFARPAAPARAAAAAPESDTAPASLRAIIYAPGRSLANIDGRILSVGDAFGAYRVLRIDERSVTLVREGTRRVLSLDEEYKPGKTP